jgi:hypothetical protein
MGLTGPIATVCPDGHGRVLGALAHADEPLTRRQVARAAASAATAWSARSTTSSPPAWGGRLACAAASGPFCTASTSPSKRSWPRPISPPPSGAASSYTLPTGSRRRPRWRRRTPCPARTGPGGRALVDLLVVRPVAAEPAR